MLFGQLARSTALLSIVGVLGVTVVRRVLPFLEWNQLDAVLPVVFVSVTGVCGSLIARPVFQALPALKCLPIRTSRLAILLSLALLAPGFAVCAVAGVSHTINPELGLAVPLYVTPVLAIVPALSIPWQYAASGSAGRVSRWSSILQLATWPFWAGSFGSLALTRLLPSWFDLFAVFLMLCSAVFCYLMARGRVDAGDFERDYQT